MTDTIPSLKLYSKKRTALLMLFFSSAFVAIGILLIVNEKQGWIGYIATAFFTLGILVGIMQLLPGSTYLEIGANGLTTCTMYRKGFIPWDEIDRFFVVTMTHNGIPAHKLVGFNYVDSYDRARQLRGILRIVGMCEGALPDTYGMKAEELTELLNTCIHILRE